MNTPAAPHYQFVTGRLAEPALRQVVERLAQQRTFSYTIDVLPISVAALMTPAWIAPRLTVRPDVTHVMLPGYCEGDLAQLRRDCPVPIVVGPRDLHALPDFFGQSQRPRDDYGAYTIEILAEINYAPRLGLTAILDQADELSKSGADVIDLGCQPGETWPEVGSCVKALRDAGHRVSIDSFNVDEVARAVRAGAELVLSVNRTNREAAGDWGCEVVAIPDDPSDLNSLEETVAHLERNRVPLRIDPVLEPIGFGLAASLLRFARVRERFPDTAMMMGIGNLTELTDVDSAGINVVLLALCEEWKIGSILTTQVINWSRTSVRECDLARRLVHFAVEHRTLPKHLEPGLIALRDAQRYELGAQRLEQLADSIRDHNYRLFAEAGQLHLIAADLHLHDPDPFVLFQRLMATDPKNIDAAHAFYLGYELAKARTALTLSKQYRQDEALDWGYLTEPESHRPPGPRRRNRTGG
jgi:dihydropteroate synthase